MAGQESGDGRTFVLVSSHDQLLGNGGRAITHASILEDKIYENPTDAGRAPELWTNTNLWLKVEKLIYIHLDLVKEMQMHMKELVDEPDPQEDWLVGTVDEFEKLKDLLQGCILQARPLILSDMLILMYGIMGGSFSMAKS